MTAPKLVALKSSNKKIVCVTAYDFTSAKLADRAGVDVVLIGDSAANVILGEQSTLPITLETMALLTRAVSKGCTSAMVVGDMPFGSYGGSVQQALDNAAVLMRAGAHAVKLEGWFPEEIGALTKVGIPVMGHLGMTPQSVNRFGGFKVQGKGAEGNRLVDHAKDLEQSGAFAIVLELVPSELAQSISSAIAIPTIGIGAGAGCDGQIQVWHDILGLTDETFKHAKRYSDLNVRVVDALKQYAAEVRQGTFPNSDHSF